MRDNKIKLILFDLDNVLVDMSDVHWEALNLALSDCGYKKISYKEHIEDFNGLPTKVKLKKLADLNIINRSHINHIWKKKQGFTLKSIDKSLKFDWEKVDMHCALIADGFDLGCVTNSITKTAKAMLKKTGQERFMSLLITNQDVKNSKPHPEPYIKAMKKMGYLPENTLIIEDSDIGIRSAHESKAHVMPVKDWTYVTHDRIYKRIRRYCSG